MMMLDHTLATKSQNAHATRLCATAIDKHTDLDQDISTPAIVAAKK